MSNLLGRLKSGETVISIPDSHIHGGAVCLLPQMLSRIESGGEDRLVVEIKFPRIIGETSCVSTTDEDKIVYAQRPGRKGFTKFVKDREAESSETAVVIMRKGEYGQYILVTVFIGVLGQPEPWDKKATRESYEYWLNHALVWGTEPVVPGTEISECPFELIEDN